MEKKHFKKKRAPKKYLSFDEVKEKEKKDAFRQGLQNNSTGSDMEVLPGKEKIDKNQAYSANITNEEHR